MIAKRYRRWHAISTLLAVGVLLSAGVRVRAYWISGPAQEETHSTAASEPSGATQGETPSAKQGSATKHGESKEKAGSLRDKIFEWANFLLILGGIVYVGKKYLGPFLDQRAQAIREDMERSARSLEEAARRLSGIEDKLQQIDEEIRALQQSASEEAGAERKRIEELSKADANKIVLAAEQEIAAATKAARQELRVYTAELAIGLAEKKIQQAISPQAEKRIFRSFLRELSDDAVRDNRGDSSRKSGAGPGVGPANREGV